MPKLIIGLVGSLASGKGVAKDYICQKYQAKSYKFSNPIRSVLKRLHIPISRENMQNISLDLRTRFGEDLFAKIIAKDVKEDETDVIVIDGVRRLADIIHLQPLAEFKLISVTADMEIRYQRVKERNENEGDKLKTLEQFQADENRETELTIPKVMAISDYSLDNNGNLEELYRQIDIIFAKITNYE